MTQEEIIRMAREAGGYLAELPNGDAWLFADNQQLERFAALVAAHERNRIAKRVADTTLSFDLKVSHMGCEESRCVLANLSDFSKLIAEDK